MIIRKSNKASLKQNQLQRTSCFSCLKYGVWCVVGLVILLVLWTTYFFANLHSQHRSYDTKKALQSFISESEKKIAAGTEELINEVVEAWDSMHLPVNVHQQMLHDADLAHAEQSLMQAPVVMPENLDPHFTDTKKKKRLAYVITITKDGFFQDGAAVLAYSIIKYSKASDYDVSFIAFVHPQVVSSRLGLSRLGFHVIEVQTPVNVTAIHFQWLREHIDLNGCCGAAELIKLTSYRLEQYHRVIHLDADTMLLNPIDELYSRNYSLIYTTDPNMASYKGWDKMPVQGGFIVLQPSLADYKNLVNIVITTEFAKGKGWNRTRIGWFWGGMTVQGVLPYYYNHVSSPNRTQIVDRCYYNTMADQEQCLVQTLGELKSAHFTVCQKPWNCFKAYVNPLCGQLHRRWFDLRKEAEQFYGIRVFDNACPHIGKKSYINMQLEQARVPYADVPFLVADDSPDRIDPLPEGGYL